MLDSMEIINMIKINEGASIQNRQYRIYSDGAKRAYQDLNPKDYVNQLSKSDMYDPLKVFKVLNKFINQSNSCFVYLGRVAKMMDYYNIPYVAWVGTALPNIPKFLNMINTSKSLPDESMMINHAWIESNNKEYEAFNKLVDATKLYKYKTITF